MTNKPEDARREALIEARLQLKYLDERWPTGTTPAVIGKIEHALSTQPAPADVPSSIPSGDGELREALERIVVLTPFRANAATAEDLHHTVRAIAETALSKEKVSTPSQIGEADVREALEEAGMLAYSQGYDDGWADVQDDDPPCNGSRTPVNLTARSDGWANYRHTFLAALNSPAQPVAGDME